MDVDDENRIKQPPAGDVRGGTELAAMRQRIADLEDRVRQAERAASEHAGMESTLRVQRDLAVALNAALDLSEVLTQGLRSAVQMPEIDSGELYLVDPLSGGLDLAARSGLHPEPKEQLSHYDPDSPQARLVMAGEPVYWPIHERVRSAEELFHHSEQVRALAVIPIRYADADGRPTVVAALNLASCTHDAFPRRVRDTLDAVATQVGSTVARAKAWTLTRESEERYRGLFENTFDLVQSVAPDGSFKYVNPAWLETLGYAEEELGSLKLFDVIHPESLAHCQALFSELTDGQPIRNFRATFLTKDGRPLAVEGNATSRWVGGKMIETRTILHDITELDAYRSEVERVAEELRRLIETANAPIFGVDAEGNVNEWNRTAARITGYSKEDVLGRDLVAEFITADYRASVGEVLEAALRGEETENFEFPLYSKGGERVMVLLNATTRRDARGNAVGVVGIGQDITERVRAREQIEASLAEKELLLREIHHRVKNNLQVISSLLFLQSQQTDDQSLIDELTVSQARVKAMALIHEQLYRSKDMARIDFQEYLPELLKGLFAAYGLSRATIRPTIDVGVVALGIDTAAPCGLVINELISNALKHAFPEDRQGEIVITLHPIDGGELELTISDDGVGLPEGFEIASSASLGLRLVKNLVENQLGGTIAVHRSDEGTRFVMRFREIQYRRRA